MVIETEIKLSLSKRDIQAIEKRIIEKGFRFIKEVSLEDIYFDTFPSIFDEKKVVKLRIEENNEKKKTSELTFKDSVSTKSLAYLENSKLSSENEIKSRKEISFSVDSVEKVIEFLDALNYKPKVTVKKDRKYYQNNSEVTICFDEGSLGIFMEIEHIGENSEESNQLVKKILDEVMKDIEYKIENRNYLQLALEELE